MKTVADRCVVFQKQEGEQTIKLHIWNAHPKIAAYLSKQYLKWSRWI